MQCQFARINTRAYVTETYLRTMLLQFNSKCVEEIAGFRNVKNRQRTCQFEILEIYSFLSQWNRYVDLVKDYFRLKPTKRRLKILNWRRTAKIKMVWNNNNNNNTYVIMIGRATTIKDNKVIKGSDKDELSLLYYAN